MGDLWNADVAAFATNWHLGASLVLMWSIVGPSLTLRRSTVDPVDGVGRFDESLVFEDVDFYLRLAATRRLLFDPTPTAEYRKHGRNTWQVFGDDVGREQYYTALERNVPRLRGQERVVALAKLKVNDHGARPKADPRRLFWNQIFKVARWAHFRQVRRRQA
jgi:hypothetical protein